MFSDQYFRPADQFRRAHLENFGQPEDGSHGGALQATLQEADEGSIEVTIEAESFLGKIPGSPNLT